MYGLLHYFHHLVINNSSIKFYGVILGFAVILKNILIFLFFLNYSNILKKSETLFKIIDKTHSNLKLIFSIFK